MLALRLSSAVLPRSAGAGDIVLVQSATAGRGGGRRSWRGSSAARTSPAT